jgi:hypothetical protein
LEVSSSRAVISKMACFATFETRDITKWSKAWSAALLALLTLLIGTWRSLLSMLAVWLVVGHGWLWRIIDHWQLKLRAIYKIIISSPYWPDVHSGPRWQNPVK